MKLAMTLLFLFFLSFGLESRELTYKEKLVFNSMEKTLRVKAFMEGRIRPGDLSFSDYLSYQIMKKGCLPLEAKFKKVEQADDQLKDQSKGLRKFYSACSESALGLGHLYVVQKD